MRWASSLEGETLRVYQTAKGGGQSGAIVAGAENVLTQAGTYTLPARWPTARAWWSTGNRFRLS